MAIPQHAEQVYSFILSYYEIHLKPPTRTHIMDGCRLSAHYAARSVHYLQTVGRINGHIPAQYVAAHAEMQRD